MKPFEAKANSWLTITSPTYNTTIVKWRFHGTMPYPMNIMILFCNMGKMISGDLQIGLNNLKKVLEK